MKKIILLISFVLVGITGFTQNEETEKIEGAVKETVEQDYRFRNDFTDDNHYAVIPLEYYGVILAYKSQKSAVNGMKDFVLKKYDMDLKEEYTEKIAIKSKFNLIDYQVEEEFLYLLFQAKKEFYITKFNFLTKTATTYSNLNKKNFVIGSMLITKGMVTLTGNIVKDKYYNLCFCLSAPLCFAPMFLYHIDKTPTILNIEMNNEVAEANEILMNNYKKTEIEIIDFVNNSSLNESVLAIKSTSNTSEIVLKGKHYKTSVSVRTLKDGSLSKDIFIKKPDKIILEQVKLNVVGEQEKIVFGTYSEKKDKVGSTSGFYICSIDSNTQSSFNKIPLKSFSSYKNEQISGDKLGFDIIFHDVLLKDETKVFLGELVSSIYTYSTGKNGTGKTFAGYSFFGALLFAVDKNGKLLWDNFIELSGSLTMDFSQKFTFTESNNNEFTVSRNRGYEMKVVTVDKNNNQVFNKEIDVYKEFRPIERFEGDRSLFTGVKQRDNHQYDAYNNEVSLWYDNVYLASGIFTKKAKNKGGVFVKQEVLYLKKIEIPN